MYKRQGDPWQSIYRFRGSVNAMRAIAAPQRHLSRSWRFGEDLACLARAILAHTSEPPALYLAYNKSTQLAAQQHFPAHVACRTMHSLAYRAMRMFEQQPRLERKLTRRRGGREAGDPGSRRPAPLLLGPVRHRHGAELHPRHRARDRRPASAALAAGARSR